MPLPELNSDYTQKWLLWICTFFVNEGMALINKDKGDTLTEHFAQWCSLKGKASGWLWRRGTLAAFLVWQGYHFFWQQTH